MSKGDYFELNTLFDLEPMKSDLRAGVIRECFGVRVTVRASAL